MSIDSPHSWGDERTPLQIEADRIINTTGLWNWDIQRKWEFSNTHNTG